MVSDYTIARYLNNMGNESRLGGWDGNLNDTDLNKTDSGMDGLNPENAAFDASEARAKYLGLGGTSSREMFATFSNQLNVLLGRPAQNYGQNGLFGQGMQYPGMQNALAAPVQGVNVYVGAPVFGPAIVTGGGENSAPAATGGGVSVNVNATVGGEGTELTATEKLDEVVKAAQEKAPEGYEPADWKRIVDDAKAAASRRADANDTDADDEFRDIINKLPNKDFSEQQDENGVVVGATAGQKKAAYGRELGDWYAQEIEGVDGTPERARLVDDTAGQDKEGFKLERASGKKLPGNVKAYTVSGDAGQHGLKEGDKIFWVEDPKSNQGGWFKEASRKGMSGQIEGLGVKGGDQEIKVGGRSDWVELEPDKDPVVEDKAAEDTKHAPLYDNFKIKDSSGETADTIKADNANVYRGNDGKWYVKQDNKFVEMPVQPKLVAGRLYFNDAKVPVDPSRVDDVPAYMDSLKEGAKEMRVRQAAIQENDSKATAERVARVNKALAEAMDETGKGKLTIVSADGSRIDIDCKAEDCKAVDDAMGFDPVDADQKRKVNAILKDLPDGVDVYLNEKKLSLSKDMPIVELDKALMKAAPAAAPETGAADSAAADALKDRVTLKSGRPIDLSGKNVDDNYIVDELAKRVEAAQKKSGTDKVSEIVIEDKVIFPKSFSTTKGGGGDEVLDAAHVRNIAYMLSEKFGYIPVSFGNATRKGDPKGSSFTTGLTKSQVEQDKRQIEKNLKSAAASAPAPDAAAPKPQSGTAAVDPKPADKPAAPAHEAEHKGFAWQQELEKGREAAASAPAAAAPAAAAPKDEAKAKASALYREGNALYEAGKYVEAEAKFQECYDIKPHYNTLKSIADCKYKQGDKKEALVYLQKAKDYPKAADAQKDPKKITAFEARVDKKIAEVKAEIAEDEKMVRPAVASKPDAPAPAPVSVAPAPAAAPAANTGWAALGNDDGTGKPSAAPAAQAKPETQGERILRESRERQEAEKQDVSSSGKTAGLTRTPPPASIDMTPPVKAVVITEVKEGEIPTDEILTSAYSYAGHEVDFILPESVQAEFDADLAKITQTAQVNSRRLVEKQPDLNVDNVYKHQLLIGVSEWAYEHTKGWKVDTKKEELSLGKACENKKGECTERTNFLYALVKRAKENLKNDKVNLNDVDARFAQIFDDSREDHVCLTAEIGGKRKFYDIGAPIVANGQPMVSRPYGKSVVVELPEHVAGLLCNKGLEEGGKKADALYAEALKLAPDSAYVKVAAAKHYYNMAAKCHNSGQDAKAREYQRKSKELMDGIGVLPGASYMASSLTNLNSSHNALSKIM